MLLGSNSDFSEFTVGVLRSSGEINSGKCWVLFSSGPTTETLPGFEFETQNPAMFSSSQFTIIVCKIQVLIFDSTFNLVFIFLKSSAQHIFYFGNLTKTALHFHRSCNIQGDNADAYFFTLSKKAAQKSSRIICEFNIHFWGFHFGPCWINKQKNGILGTLKVSQ